MAELTFRNRDEFGFNDEGCIYGLIKLHEDYLNGRLSNEECRAVEDHILDCEGCERAGDICTNSKLKSTPPNYRA